MKAAQLNGKRVVKIIFNLHGYKCLQLYLLEHYCSSRRPNETIKCLYHIDWNTADTESIPLLGSSVKFHYHTIYYGEMAHGLARWFSG